jgi:hypothetical protein
MPPFQNGPWSYGELGDQGIGQFKEVIFFDRARHGVKIASLSSRGKWPNGLAPREITFWTTEGDTAPQSGKEAGFIPHKTSSATDSDHVFE